MEPLVRQSPDNRIEQGDCAPSRYPKWAEGRTPPIHPPVALVEVERLHQGCVADWPCAAARRSRQRRFRNMA